jgi:hypothetical protein
MTPIHIIILNNVIFYIIIGVSVSVSVSVSYLVFVSVLHRVKPRLTQFQAEKEGILEIQEETLLWNRLLQVERKNVIIIEEQKKTSQI